MNNFHLERYQENLEGGVFERTLMRELVKNFLSKSSCEWIWSSIVSKRIFHSQVIKVKPDVSRSEGTWRIPIGGRCHHIAQQSVGFLASSFPDCLCCVSVSASPARSPVFSHLASSLRGLWTIRAYKSEQRFQELFDTYQDLHSGL